MQEFFFSDGGGSPHFDFGGAASPQEYQMNLTFIEAAKGVEKELKVNILDTCETCGGTGNQVKPNNQVYKALEHLFLTFFEFYVFQAGTSPDRCTQCSGTGMETVSTGPFMMRSTCRRCHGKGVFNKNPCFACRGAGQTKQRKTVKGEHNAYSFTAKNSLCKENF